MKYRVITFIAFLALVILFIQTDTFALLVAGDFAALAASDSFWMLTLLTLIIMIVQNLFTVIPLVLVITFNLSIYGFTYGYLWSLATSIVGAVICFYAVRFWFQDLFTKRINDNIRKKLEQSAFMYVFISRIFPFVPTSLINIAAGLSTMRVRHFLLSTLLGNLIYFLVLSFIIHGLLQIGRWEYYLYAGIALLFICAYLVYKAIKRRRNIDLTQ